MGDDVGGRGGRVAGDVQLWIDAAFSEPAEDADDGVEDAGQEGEGLGMGGEENMLRTRVKRT